MLRPHAANGRTLFSYLHVRISLNMPIIYRQRSQSFSDSESDLENIAPTINDADDSIVLSDLVRTGEASRLRRRGAMRLDHGYPTTQNQPQPTSPTVIVVGSPSWDSESEEPQGGPVYSRERFRNIRGPRFRRVAGDDELTYTYTIFCGGEESDSEVEYASQAYQPSILPVYPSSSSRVSSLSPRRKKTNGCGAVLHMSAAPRQRQGTWLAKDVATSAVIPMDACYFDREAALKIVRNGCGCFREGVGCALW